MDKKTEQPFYVGEKVIAVDAVSGSTIKNGQIYTICSCEQDYGQDRNLYWYVGIVGGLHNRIRPTIFAPLESASLMQFEKLNESVPVHAN